MFDLKRERRSNEKRALTPPKIEEMVLIPLSNLCFHVFTSKKDEIQIGKTDVVALFSACDRNWILSGF